MRRKWILLIAAVLCGTLFLAKVFFDCDFPAGTKHLSYTRHPLLGTSSKAEGEIFVDQNDDCYIITEGQELLRQRGRLKIAETVVRADANRQGLIWLNASGDLYLHSEEETVLVADRVCEFALSEDSVYYFRENGGLYACTPQNNSLLFNYPVRKYPSPGPRTMDLLANDKWVFLAGTGEADNCYYDLSKECLVVMDQPPYFTPPSDTAVLWGDYLLCLMGYADGGMIYNLVEGSGQPLDLKIDASEHYVRSSATFLKNTLYLSVQYEPPHKVENLPIQEATFMIDVATFEWEKMDGTFYKQLFTAENRLLGISGKCIKEIIWHAP